MTIYNEAGNEMPANNSLRIHDCLSSENQEYYLVLQDDGNLCVYKRKNDGNHTFVWGTMTSNKGANKLTLQQDGNLVLYAAGNNALWSTETMSTFNRKYASSEFKPVRLVLENDGKLVLCSQTEARFGLAEITRKGTGT